jgi:hypothetical protein
MPYERSPVEMRDSGVRAILICAIYGKAQRTDQEYSCQMSKGSSGVSVNDNQDRRYIC